MTTTASARLGLALLFTVLLGCTAESWNNPYPASESRANVLYRSFDERPKHLDPVQSYSSNEYEFIAQIYEPPLQYHFLKRPYTLVPATAARMPRVTYTDAQGTPLAADTAAQDIAYSVYEISIKPGIMYQPHPAFASDAAGRPLYMDLTPGQLEDVYTLADFEQTGTRELVAADYVYQIKRLAHPKVHSPIFGIMSQYIVGLKEYAATLRSAYDALAPTGDRGQIRYLDLTRHDLAGAEVLDRYTYRITIRGKYPQLLYWLAMPFFAPIPPEADRFYAQPGLDARNINLDWYPVGTGPYMLTVNDPNRRMVMRRNPNFHGESYPLEGEPEDEPAGLLRDAGKPLPFIDKVVYSLDKESIPIWNKFLQGYYDSASITSDSFDQAISISATGDPGLTDAMRQKGIKLATAVATSTYYTGFNMMDPVVGGASERARKLRRAIAVAVDYEEFISIFMNGRGLPAHGPVPPGLFGHVPGRAGINPYVYDWVDGKPRRKPIAEARRLLAEAGYPDGRDALTGEPLLLNLDTAATGPDAKAVLDWWRKQFRKLNIQLVIRATDYNRFQEKMLKGTAQIFQWGWNADYPDPENFMFLLYGPNRKVVKNGENAANYDNARFNRLFDQMKNMDNGPQRQALIDEMVEIARRDGPWLWGWHPVGFSLYHEWYFNVKPNLIANNTLKYKRIDPELREQRRAEWNKPVVWPIYLAVIVLVLSLLPGIVTYIRKEHRPSVAQQATR